MSENKNTHENADLLKRLRHIAGLDAENYGALPEDAAEWKAADLIETITKQRDELLSELEKLTGVLATIGITTGLYDNEQDALKAACDAIARAKGEQ